MTYQGGFVDGYSISVLPVLLSDVAAHARRNRFAPAVRVAERWGIDDIEAMDWILACREAGLDVGLPRDEERYRIRK